MPNCIAVDVASLTYMHSWGHVARGVRAPMWFVISVCNVCHTDQQFRRSVEGKDKPRGIVHFL